MNFGVVVMPWVGAGLDDLSCSAKNCKTHGIAGHFSLFYNAVSTPWNRYVINGPKNRGKLKDLDYT